MKKRDFLAGMICGVFIARMSVLDLSKVSQIITVALIVLALSSLWEWIKNATTKNTSRTIIRRRMKEHTDNLVIQKNK
jgi:hypothetical protein